MFLTHKYVGKREVPLYFCFGGVLKWAIQSGSLGGGEPTLGVPTQTN